MKNKNLKRLVGSTFATAIALSMMSPMITGAIPIPTEGPVGSLTIKKYEQAPGTAQGNQTGPNLEQEPEGTPVADVTFEVKQVESYNSDTQAWEDVTNGKTYTVTTDETGSVSITDMPLGRYEVKETDAPAHIIKNPKTFTVDIPMTTNNGQDVSYDVTIYPKNETILTDVGLIKKGEDGKPLQGVEFGYYKADTNELVNTLTTNAQGEITLDNVPAGSYYLQETKTPDNYALNNQKIHFVVGKAGEAIEAEEGAVDLKVDSIKIVSDIPMVAVDTISVGDSNISIHPDNEDATGISVKVMNSRTKEILESKLSDLSTSNSGKHLLPNSLKLEVGDVLYLVFINENGTRGKVSKKSVTEEVSTTPRPDLPSYINMINTFSNFIKTGLFPHPVQAAEKPSVTWTHVTDFTENDRVDKESGRHLIDAVNFLKPTLKKDADGKQDQKVNRGEEFKFNLTLSTPGDVKTYKKLGAFDVLDERLEFTNNWEVTGTTKENLNFTFDAPTNRLEWSVKDFTQLTPGTPIKITFGAKVKKDVTSTDPITNIAKLTYDNNKGDFSKEGEEPESPNVTVTPKDGGLQVVKIDGKDQTRLQNAKFTVTTDLLGNEVVDATGTSIRLNNAEAGRLEDVATNAQGEFLITGLTPGTYYLHETVAPGDYRKLIIPVKVTVEDTQTATTEIKNYKSLFDLPATGGLGAILVITSAGALGYKGYKKSKKDEQ